MIVAFFLVHAIVDADFFIRTPVKEQARRFRRAHYYVVRKWDIFRRFGGDHDSFC